MNKTEDNLLILFDESFNPGRQRTNVFIIDWSPINPPEKSINCFVYKNTKKTFSPLCCVLFSPISRPKPEEITFTIMDDTEKHRMWEDDWWLINWASDRRSSYSI